MKGFSSNHFWLLLFLVCCLLLNTHIIVDGTDVDLLLKDHMTFRGTFVDATDLGWSDYLKLPPRVRNHLLIDKKCFPLFQDWKMRAARKGADLKTRIKKWELQLHQWLSKKLD